MVATSKKQEYLSTISGKSKNKLLFKLEKKKNKKIKGR